MSSSSGAMQLDQRAQDLVYAATGAAWFLGEVEPTRWRLSGLHAAEQLDLNVAAAGARCVAFIFQEILQASLVVEDAFPRVRPLITGLVFRRVEQAGLIGSSALHVVQQHAHLLAESLRPYVRQARVDANGEGLAVPTSSTVQQAIAEATGRALEGLDEPWLATQVEAELAAARRALLGAGVQVPEDLYGGRSLPQIDPVRRKLEEYCKPSGTVVFAGSAAIGGEESALLSSAVETPRRDELSIQWGKADVQIREGKTTVTLTGVRRVSLLRKVVEAEGRETAWKTLVEADLHEASAELERRMRKKPGRQPQSPRFATAVETLRRTGRHIRNRLGKLGYHWHQNGHGVRWDPEVQ